MKSNKTKIAIVLFLATLQGFSQEILTKKQALAITLENNFGIKIANNNFEVARNNAGIYNSGYLPTAALNSGGDYRNNIKKLFLQTHKLAMMPKELVQVQSQNLTMSL